MFQRSYFRQLIERLEELRKFIQVIMGSRQVGKTTLVNQVTEKINLLSTFVSADAVHASNRIWLEQHHLNGGEW